MNIDVPYQARPRNGLPSLSIAMRSREMGGTTRDLERIAKVTRETDSSADAATAVTSFEVITAASVLALGDQ